MRDVAALAGVSAKTVSRVSNNDRYVSADVRARVRQAIDELGYKPNALARTFRSTDRDAAIGVAVPDLADPFFAAAIQAIEQVARAHGAATFVTSLGRDPDGEQAAVEALLARQVVGLIMAPVAPDQRYLQGWQSRAELVFIDRRPGRLRAESMVEDDFAGAEQATGHLLQHGHRRIALVGDSRHIPTSARRLAGYTAALQAAGREPDAAHVLFTDELPGGTASALPLLLETRRPATAIFISNARSAIELLPELHRAGRSDLAHLSFGDFPLAATLSPAVTVIDQDPAALATLAAHRLFERVADPSLAVRRQRVLPVPLVRRQSCAVSARHPAGRTCRLADAGPPARSRS